MNLFTELYVELDQTNKTNEKVEAMRFYFERARPHDSAWATISLAVEPPSKTVVAVTPSLLFDRCVGESNRTETAPGRLPGNM